MSRNISDEPLVQASLYPEKILTRSVYYSEGLPGSLPDVWLRESVYESLLVAAESLHDDLRLVIWDGWRSFELQTYLYEKQVSRMKTLGFNDDEAHKKASVYVAYPSKDYENVSNHLSGGAVDLTIADKYGHYLPMGGNFDDTAGHSATNYYDSYDDGDTMNITPEKIYCWNRKTLLRIMTEAGFTNYEPEWWHFDFQNRNWAERKGFTGEVYGYTEPLFKWKN
ncbi:MAG: D-alanyl-D-alanine carboxypeptidase family protein [Synergistaceae bacterium]|nr:D-alanyl-D-alanine carboxypeptidase family protein [Synergistaceae bacterium]